MVFIIIIINILMVYECKVLLKLATDYITKRPKSIVDVGCGQGRSCEIGSPVLLVKIGR